MERTTVMAKSGGSALERELKGGFRNSSPKPMDTLTETFKRLGTQIPAHRSRSRARPIPSRNRRNHFAVGGLGDAMLSQSCPPKPIIGSVPTPQIKDTLPPLTLPPTPSSSLEAEVRMGRSLFSGIQFQGMQKQVYAQSCPSHITSRRHLNFSSSVRGATTATSDDNGAVPVRKNSLTVLSFLEQSNSLDARHKMAKYGSHGKTPPVPPISNAVAFDEDEFDIDGTGGGRDDQDDDDTFELFDLDD